MALREQIRAIMVDVAGGNCQGPCPSASIKCEDCGADRIMALTPLRELLVPVDYADWVKALRPLPSGTPETDKVVPVLQGAGNVDSTMLRCPFCREDDFDKIGLAYHLRHHCEAYADADGFPASQGGTGAPETPDLKGKE